MEENYRRVKILVGGYWEDHPYDELRTGDLFRLFESNSNPAYGDDKVWLAVSDIATDPTGTIQGVLAGRQSPLLLTRRP